MPRRFADGGRLVIASHNPGKVEEIAALLMPFGVETVSAAALGLPEPEETGDSFEANAALKARAAAERSGLPALADDSGTGGPGVGRGARHLLGALGRTVQGFQRRDGAGRARTR